MNFKAFRYLDTATAEPATQVQEPEKQEEKPNIAQLLATQGVMNNTGEPIAKPIDLTEKKEEPKKEEAKAPAEPATAKVEPEKANRKAEAIIKNTYRTLMTRGMKGCYVYFTDKETAEYFKLRVD